MKFSITEDSTAGLSVTIGTQESREQARPTQPHFLKSGNFPEFERSVLQSLLSLVTRCGGECREAVHLSIVDAMLALEVPELDSTPGSVTLGCVVQYLESSSCFLLLP